MAIKTNKIYFKNNSIYKKKNKFEFKKSIYFITNLRYKVSIILMFRFIIIFLFFTYINSNVRNLEEINPDNNKLTLIVKGSGTKNIFNNIPIKPDIVIINNKEQIGLSENTNSFDLDQENNIIILKWKTLFTSLREIFKNIDCIESIDFSNFNTSKVTDMSSMFEASSVKSINFKNFDTSKVTDMANMFSGIKMTSLDLSSFKTSKVESMKYMFSYCDQLKELNLANFDTSSVKYMEYMFWHTESLKVLNLYNFNISSVLYMSYMFEGCKNLVYINLISFQEKDELSIDNIFSKDLNLLVYCIDKDKSPKIFQKLGTNSKNDCYNNCFSKSKINIVQKECNNIDNCILYECEIEDNPDSSYSIISEEPIYSHNTNNIFSDISENKESTYYIEKAEIAENNEKNESADEKDDNTENNENDVNTDNNEKNENTEISNINQIIESTGKIVNKEMNGILQNFSSEKFFKESNEIIIENITIKDEIIKTIKEDILNRNLESLIINITEKKEDLLVKSNDTLYQITSTNNQNNNIYKNISTLGLGNCEERLKKIYNIDKNLSLIIFKVDYYKEGSLIPVICYEIFHPLNYTQLDLNYCKDILIQLNIPVTIDEDNYFKYDPNSNFYNDECYSYTTENGTDIILKDRQNEYNDNNLSICENNCTLTGYDSYTQKASCQCETKSKFKLISEIIEDKNILTKDFNNADNSDSNIDIIKCYNTLFSKEGLLTNIGSYILIVSIFLCMIISIVFYKCGYNIIETDISEIIISKTKNNKNNNNNKKNISNENQKVEKKRKRNKNKTNKTYKINTKKKVIKENKNSKTNKLKNTDIINRTKAKYNINKKNKTNKRKSKASNPNKRFSKKYSIIKTNEKSNLMCSQNNLKGINLIINNQHIVKGNLIVYKKANKFSKENLIIQKYKNDDLNFLNFKQALKYDKRTFCQYYSYLIKIKNYILFSFYPIEDYNLKIIKIFLFLLFFDIYLAINTLFFNDSTIHQIYKDKGEYNLKYFLPQIIYSFIISYTINSVIKFLSLSERNILQLKHENILNNIIKQAKKAKKFLIMKYILFFVISLVFLFFFWYYLSSFCAVYKNSQIYLIKNTVISYGISLIFPFIYFIFPGFLRIISLKNKGNKCLFQLCKIIQFL